jgi:hypothetical protein
MTVLTDLKIYGFTRIQETAILASLYLGEPLLFIGPKGVAKTEVVSSLGAALRESSRRKYPNDSTKWFNYQVYDASKLNFEDLVGYPNPNDMRKDPPTVTYIPTKSTIWDKQLVAFDEINRCQEDRQSNLFEIIRSRKLHGISTNNYFIFSTMNPYGDAGTLEMSDALVDRHLFYLKVENFSTMPYIDREKVINRLGNIDAVGLRFWNKDIFEFDISEKLDDSGKPIINNVLADIGDTIIRIMDKAKEEYLSIHNQYGSKISSLVNNVVSSLSSIYSTEKKLKHDEVEISGRRASAMLRGLIAMKAIDTIIKDEYKLENVSTSYLFSNSISLFLPIGISSTTDPAILSSVSSTISQKVTLFWDNIDTSESQNDLGFNINKDASFNEYLDHLLNSYGDTNTSLVISKLFNENVINKLYDQNKSPEVYSNLRIDFKILLSLLSREYPLIFSNIQVDSILKDKEIINNRTSQVQSINIECQSLTKYIPILQMCFNSYTTLNQLIAFYIYISVELLAINVKREDMNEDRIFKEVMFIINTANTLNNFSFLNNLKAEEATQIVL